MGNNDYFTAWKLDEKVFWTIQKLMKWLKNLVSKAAIWSHGELTKWLMYEMSSWQIEMWPKFANLRYSWRWNLQSFKLFNYFEENLILKLSIFCPCIFELLLVLLYEYQTENLFKVLSWIMILDSWIWTLMMRILIFYNVNRKQLIYYILVPFY